jgi:hypothetical protein
MKPQQTKTQEYIHAVQCELWVDSDLGAIKLHL